MSELLRTELDSTSYPEWRDYILEAEAVGQVQPKPSRTYPGYSTWSLPRLGNRWWPSLDRTLAQRRSPSALSTTQPSRKILARLLQASHGITGPMNFGPVPSAGGLQALELYCLTLADGWLPLGLYHYDRRAHHLAQLQDGADLDDWTPLVPSLQRFTGGALLWALVGDGQRAASKYAERGHRFLLLEAGHLMQNLCLVSTSLGLATVPLGGFFERELADKMQLLPTDHVLYAGVCGTRES